MEHITTITVRKETKQKIAQLGNKDETYDHILSRLLANPSTVPNR